MRPTRTLRQRAGFTLVELAIAAALLVLLMSSAIMAGRGGIGAMRATQETSELETRVRRALDRAAFELLAAGATELLPDPDGDFGTSNMQFRSPVGLVGTAPTWGPTMRLAFEYAPGETDDSVDNDGNGLIDDGLLVLTRDVGGADQRVVLCRGVREYLEGEVPDGDDNNGNGVRDEGGFNVHRVGDVLFLRLSVEQATVNGSLVRTLETSVRLRN